jgi:hypothetical protein
MRFTVRRVMGCAVAPLCVMLAPVAARAGYIAAVIQSGNDVVATGSGTINTAGLTFKPSTSGGDHDTGYCVAFGPGLGIGPSDSTSVDKYTGTIAGPANFGSGHSFFATSGSGDMVEMAKFAGVMDVPLNYVSGAALSGTSTFANRTLASMGLTEGTYVWTWGSGADADSYTLNVGAVPEPCSAGAAAVVGIGLLARRRKRK